MAGNCSMCGCEDWFRAAFSRGFATASARCTGLNIRPTLISCGVWSCLCRFWYIFWFMASLNILPTLISCGVWNCLCRFWSIFRFLASLNILPTFSSCGVWSCLCRFWWSSTFDSGRVVLGCCQIKWLFCSCSFLGRFLLLIPTLVRGPSWGVVVQPICNVF